jgi:hypothetical protein
MKRALDLVVDVWWLAFQLVRRRSPIVVTTRQRPAELERNALDLGREAEHFWSCGESATPC